MHIAEVPSTSLESLAVTACTDTEPLSTAKTGSQAMDYAQLSGDPDSHWHLVPTLLIDRVQRLGVIRWIHRGGMHESPATVLGLFACVQPYTNASAWSVWMDACAQVTESQNHRMFGVGRDLCGSSSPTPLPKQGQPEQAAQDLVQPGLDYL